MLTLIADLPDGVVGVDAHGKVTADDYEKVLIPAVEAAKREWRDRVGLLYVLGLGHLRAWVTSAPVDGARFY